MNKEAGDGVKITMYLRVPVVARLDEVAEAQNKSRSEMANAILSQGLGIIEPWKGEQKEYKA